MFQLIRFLFSHLFNAYVVTRATKQVISIKVYEKH